MKELKRKIREYADYRNSNNDGCAFYKLASYILGQDVNAWLKSNTSVKEE